MPRKRLEFHKDAVVPCNGCVECCRNSTLVVLLPMVGDDLSLYQYEDGDFGPQLKHKPNGDCIHLVDDKCEVYVNRPIMCRQFDCRGMAKKFGKKHCHPKVYKEGMKRMETYVE